MDERSLSRFGVSMDKRLLESFDAAIEKKGYPNRSEAIRDLVRDMLVKGEWAEESSEVVATLTLVYDHETRELTDRLTHFQHMHLGVVLATMHIHLDHHNCLEVLVLKGRPDAVREIADGLLGAKGVKHGSFSPTTTGRGIF